MGKILADLRVIKVSAACLSNLSGFVSLSFLLVGTGPNVVLVESCVGWMEGKRGGWGRKEAGECECSGTEMDWGKCVRECQQAGRAPMLPGQALLPLFPSTAHSTYPSNDVRCRKTATGGNGVSAIEHKAHGDSHDSTGLHDQGLDAGLDKALGADSGL